MQKLKSILGYFWAILALLIALATFFGYYSFSKTLAQTTGMKVHPKYTGGEVTAVIDHGSYSTSIHRPVFDALVGQNQEGFVQINWAPAAGLPPVVRESIDYDRDGREDFVVTLDTKTGKVDLVKSNRAALDAGKTYHLRDGWALRVLLKQTSTK